MCAVAQCPTYASRIASTAERIGMKCDRTSSRRGVRAIGSISPDRSIDGIDTALTIGPNSCGLSTFMATVYDIEPRATVVAVSPEVGLIEGYDRFMKVIESAAGLRARLRCMQQESLTLREATLREDRSERRRPAARPDGRTDQLDPHDAALPCRRRDDQGRAGRGVSREALGPLDEREGLLGEPVLNYAVRDA